MNTEHTIIKMYFNNKPFVLFDVGAHSFSFGREICQLHPLATAYGFEADVTTFESHKNYNADKAALHYYNNAISDVDGTCVFYPSVQFIYEDSVKQHRDSGSLCTPIVDENGIGLNAHKGLQFDVNGIEVRTVRIDTFCKLNNITHIDYMHIDVQGAEDKVIKGLGDIRPSFIFAETNCFGNSVYQTTTTVNDFNNLMNLLGYYVIDSDNSDTLYAHNDFDIKQALKSF